MTRYEVAREGRATVTLHATASTVATRTAGEVVENGLQTLDDADDVVRWAVLSADVDEFPVGPFEPHAIAVTFEVAVAVAAIDESEALELGRAAIDDALDRTELENWRYAGEPSVAS